MTVPIADIQRTFDYITHFSLASPQLS